MPVQPPKPQLPPLNALRAFESAARLNSFKAAGEELHVTPGAVAQHIKALEAWAGEGGEVIELTDEAKAEFDAASAALAEQLIAELEADGIGAAEWAAALKQ